MSPLKEAREKLVNGLVKTEELMSDDNVYETCGEELREIKDSLIESLKQLDAAKEAIKKSLMDTQKIIW